MTSGHEQFAIEQLRKLDKRAEANEIAWLGMSFRELAALYRYVLRAQKIMLLEHWRIEVLTRPASGEFMARMSAPYGQYFAEFEIGDKWDEYTEPERRATIAHELLHLIGQHRDEIIYKDLKPHLGAAHRWVDETYSRAMELANDQLSVLVMRLLPPYPMVTHGKRRTKRRSNKNPK